MTWSEIASSRASGGASTGATTVTATFGASVPAGSLMWAAVVYESGGGGNMTGVASDEGTPTAFTRRGSEQQIPGPDVWLSLWTGVATESDTHTITATFNISRNIRGIFIGAFSGNDVAGTLNAALSEYDAATNSPSVTIATTVDGCLLIGVSINSNAVGATAGGGFSSVVTGGGPDYPIAFEWAEQVTQNASTSINFTSLSGTPGFSITGAAFEPLLTGGATRQGKPAQLNTTQGRPVQLRRTGINPFTFVR